MAKEPVNGVHRDGPGSVAIQIVILMEWAG